jgi:hypothetical protein
MVVKAECIPEHPRRRLVPMADLTPGLVSATPEFWLFQDFREACHASVRQ